MYHVVVEELPLSVDQATNPHAPALIGDIRNSSRGRHNASEGGDIRSLMPNKCNACGGLDHILSSSALSNDAHLKRTLAKRKMKVQKYGAPSGHTSHNALMSDMHESDTDGDARGAGPLEMECTDEYDDTEVSATFCSIAFCASTPPGRDLSQLWVVDYACSINLIAFRSDFVSFDNLRARVSCG
jgi:hypothetical protein